MVGDYHPVVADFPWSRRASEGGRCPGSLALSASNSASCQLVVSRDPLFPSPWEGRQPVVILNPPTKSKPLMSPVASHTRSEGAVTPKTSAVWVPNLRGQGNREIGQFPLRELGGTLSEERSGSSQVIRLSKSGFHFDPA
jgi:hypothetical protein